MSTDNSQLVLNLLQDLKTDLQTFKSEMQAFKSEMLEFKSEMQAFKADVNRRLEQAEQNRRDDRAEMNRQFIEIKDELKEVKYDLRVDSRKLDEVYDARNRVTVNFTRAFALGNASLTAVLAVIVSFFVSSHR